MPARVTRAPAKAARKNTKKKPPAKSAAKPKVGSIQQKMVDSLHALADAPTSPLHILPPEEYDVLTAPLREFTRVSPALVEALAALPRLGSVLAMSAERMDRAADRIEKGERAAFQARSNEILARLADAAADLDDVRQTLLVAISTIPREEDYVPAARELREIASVSPSLIEWLKEVPKLAAPLTDSLTALREAAERVATARAAVTAALQALAPMAERETATPPNRGR